MVWRQIGVATVRVHGDRHREAYDRYAVKVLLRDLWLAVAVTSSAIGTPPNINDVQDREAAQRAYVQLVVPPDLIARPPDWNWANGWPLDWPNIPSVPLATVDLAPDELSNRLGVCFQEGLDLGDGLGARSIALLELRGGRRIALIIYPGLPSVELALDPLTAWEPEWVSQGHERLLTAILTALGIDRQELSWIAAPESQELVELQDRAQVAATAAVPRFVLHQVVRVLTTRPPVVCDVGQEGVIVARWIRADGAWQYAVHLYRPARAWRFGEAELESTGSTDDTVRRA